MMQAATRSHRCLILETLWATAMHFSNSYVLLNQEGHLFQSCLLQGLDALRRATISQKGDFYVAFFQLSIGMERLMKMIIIIEHMAKNGLVPPTDESLKKLGHKLVSLLDRLCTVQARTLPHPLTAISRSSLAFHILAFLGEFADATRYFNVKALSSSGQIDPLAKWSTIMARILQEEVSKRQQSRIGSWSDALAAVLSPAVFVIGHDLNQRSLDVHQAILQPQLQELAARHAVWAVLTLLKSLRQLLDDVTMDALELNLRVNRKEQALPYMYEFLDFALIERRQALRKRKWS